MTNPKAQPPKRILTGITTTGTPHLGNYVGAIRPAIVASHDAQAESFFFLADYHALIKCDDPARIARSRLEIAATWLAAGLDPTRVYFYRQSDIPEIPELTWLLTCVTGKGLMNRAHAYKAATDINAANGEDVDAGINMGLYCYPILMGADILMFNATHVPVGRDQVQHIEMARDMAQRFNHLFGRGEELFVLPQVVIDEAVATLPGLDGRKMSKSYDNTIPLFEGGPKRLKETVGRIVTDSRAPGEPKDPQSNALATLYQAFASAEQCAEYEQALREGLGWGEAKQRLLAQLEHALAPMREQYEALIAKPSDIEDVLQVGAQRARSIATPFLARLRDAVGLRRMSAPMTVENSIATETKAAKPSIKQYREADGQFYFKLLDAEGRLLMISPGFAQPRDAGQMIGKLKSSPAAVTELAGRQLGEGCSDADVEAALLAMAVE
ncbi:tryptophan--tRNA ligase [Pseudomarimonas arenosa]|uniref:Tryptophan--tRNA ligase n=1 Tax=Pseudomarimonas arenosa TaxID=2774145 RepID=A0AAW3ZPI4_9GAMM|nr:tryptophan--tRNA ligase [Pseudomarimonas arenosa]MBD8528093.1 tryptophan--tRNA ligase [Pseudomarimonas arenosa]